MKNEFRYILLTLIVSFSFLSSVVASYVDVSLHVENDVVASGTEASIMVNLKSDVLLTECYFKVITDDSIKEYGKSGANSWNLGQDSGIDGFLLKNNSATADDLSNGKNVLMLSPKVNGDSEFTVKTVYCMSDTGEKIENISDASVSLKVTASIEDTTLSSLSVIGGQLTTIFSPTATDIKHIIVLDSPNFGLVMTTTDPSYQDKIVVKDIAGNEIKDYGNITFSDPSGQKIMPLTITVNGKTTYSLDVQYSQDELDNTLKSVTINGVELELKDGEYNYSFVVDKDVSELVIEPVLNDSDNFMLDGNFQGNIIITDRADIIIVVEPKSSDIGAEAFTYTIEIIKEKDTSNNNGGSNSGSSNVGNNGNSSNSSSNNNNSNVNSNPGTGDISMFVMSFILISSFVSSIILYRKNLEGYR